MQLPYISLICAEASASAMYGKGSSCTAANIQYVMGLTFADDCTLSLHNSFLASHFVSLSPFTLPCFLFLYFYLFLPFPSPVSPVRLLSFSLSFPLTFLPLMSLTFPSSSPAHSPFLLYSHFSSQPPDSYLPPTTTPQEEGRESIFLASVVMATQETQFATPPPDTARLISRILRAKVIYQPSEGHGGAGGRGDRWLWKCLRCIGWRCGNKDGG